LKCWPVSGVKRVFGTYSHDLLELLVRSDKLGVSFLKLGVFELNLGDELL
jgi:hypothetical protein